MNTSKKQWNTPEMVIHGSVEDLTASKTVGTNDVPMPQSPTLTASEL